MGLSAACFSGPLTKTMYKQLWFACAGPQVSIPSVGERVYYFPEGHMEQIEAYTHNGLQQQPSSFYLPAKILCKVVNVQLLAEPDTNDMYADITLLPYHDQSEITVPDPLLLEPSTGMVHSICKTLTTSETSTSGGLALPLKDAVDCLPTLDMSQQPSWQEVVASDLQDNEWHFCHMLQEHSKRHFLTTGWSDFVNAKKLVPGDAIVFLRGGNGELCVGIRSINHTPSVTSTQTHLAILATASHAITSGTRFLVTYRPRASPSPFIISLNKYLEAQSYRFSVGMKFEMKFEGEEVLERRFSGTIVGVGETASSKWPADSEWRSLKVRWDQGMPVSCPTRVSSWEIKPPKRSQWSCCCFGI